MISCCTKLVSLHIDHGNKIKHFPDPRKCSALETVQINTAQFPNLDGLKECPALKKVTFRRCHKLTSITGLMSSPNLEEVLLPAARMLQDIGDLEALPTFHKFDRSNPCASKTRQPCPPKNNGSLNTRTAVEAYIDKIRFTTAIQKKQRIAVEDFVNI